MFTAEQIRESAGNRDLTLRLIADILDAMEGTPRIAYVGNVRNVSDSGKALDQHINRHAIGMTAYNDKQAAVMFQMMRVMQYPDIKLFLIWESDNPSAEIPLSSVLSLIDTKDITVSRDHNNHSQIDTDVFPELEPLNTIIPYTRKDLRYRIANYAYLVIELVDESRTREGQLEFARRVLTYIQFCDMKADALNYYIGDTNDVGVDRIEHMVRFRTSTAEFASIMNLIFWYIVGDVSEIYNEDHANRIDEKNDYKYYSVSFLIEQIAPLNGVMAASEYDDGSTLDLSKFPELETLMETKHTYDATALLARID